jgi:phenylalanyl-tRNA synthetase beta chain
MLPAPACRALAGADIPRRLHGARLAALAARLAGRERRLRRSTAPTNRPDLTREVDLIEEVLRLWGEDRSKPTLPAASNHAGGLTVDQQRIRKIGATLRALASPRPHVLLRRCPRPRASCMSEEGPRHPVQIINPLVADQSQMRRSMLPGLLRSVAYNIDHGVKNGRAL